MNIAKFIHLLIIIVVMATTTTILWLLSLPILGFMGIPSIRPYWLSGSVWYVITLILKIISAIGNTIFLCVWVVWKILRALDFFPLDILFVDAILSLSIFTEPDHAGLFRLYDRLFNIGGSLENKFKQIGKALTSFLLDNKKIYAEVTKPLADSISVYDEPQKSSSPIKKDNPDVEASKQSLLNDTEKKTVDELYQQCLEEKMKDIKMNISSSDKIQLQTANSTAKISCKTKSIFNIQNLVTAKIP
jgi:hypothetical protein